MNSKLKRVLSMMVILVMVLPVLLVNASADTTVTPIADCLTVTDSRNTGSISGTTVTVTASSRTPVTNTITITNIGSSKAKIKFDYSASGDIDSFSESSNSGSKEIILAVGGTYTMSISNTNGYVVSKKTATLTLSNFFYEPVIEGPVTITHNSYGSVTVGGTTVANGGTSATITADGAELKATPVSGATFVAWVKKDTNEIISQNATYTLMPYATSMNIWAVFTKSTETPYFKVGNTLYTDINTAFTAASSGSNKVVVLISDGTLGTGTYDIPSGVTLLAPLSRSDSAIDSSTATDDSGNLASTLEHANVAFVSDRQDDGQGNYSIDGVLDPDHTVTYTLTVPSGTTININSGSKLVVGGTVVGGSYATQGICGATAGAHSNLQLEGTINVNSGAILSATGYIRGNGTINVADGGSVYQPYIMMDHKDGHYVSGAKNEGCFPFYRHALLNIQSKLVLNSGADLYGYVTFFTQAQSGILEAQYNVTCMHVVGSGSENALFLLGTGAKLEMTYDANKTLNVTSSSNNNTRGYYAKVGRTTMSFTGDVALGYMALSINVLGSNYSMSTETSVFPIPYNYNIIQNSGTFSANYELALLPGATFTVADGAALTIASGVNFAVYDGFRDYSIRSESLTLDGEDGTGGTWAQFHYPTSANLRSYGFSSTAELIVNGTLNVNGNLGGTVQTGGTTGTIVMGASAGNSVTSVLGVVNKSNTITIPIINKSFSFLGSCGKTTRTLTAQVFPTNKTTPLTLEAGKTYTTTGAGTNTLSSYTYGVYTTHDASGATTETKTDLNATVTGTWCVSGHSWVDATCTAPKTCSVCGATQGEKLPHSYGTEPTFTWAGDYSCTAVLACGTCGDEQSLTVNVTSEITTNATCSAEGVRTYTATATDSEGNTYTDTTTQAIEKLPHTYNAGAVTFAWTENNCQATYVCTVCGTSGSDACTVTSETEEATCQQAGQTVHTASISLNGQTYTDTKTVVLDQLAHQYTAPTFAWSADYSTCQAAYTCSVGGESHTVDCAVNTATTDASCTAPGKTTYTASVEIAGTAYSDVKEVEIPQLTHSFTSYTHKDDATCTTKATEIASCDHGCGTTDIRQVGEALGHSYTNYVSDGNATCTADGTKTATCDNGCSTQNTVTDTGSKLAHKYTDYTYNNDATCQKDGTKTASCGYGCGAQSTVTAEGTKTDHVFGDYVSNNDVTCTTAGTKTRTCTFGCGTTETVTDENAPALDHSFTNYISNEDATCLANGTETAKCDRCDVTDTREDADSALGHSFTNYVPNDDAVCGVDGTKTATCDNGCGTTKTVTNEGSALEHSFTHYVSDDNATCLQNCTETAYCDHECGVTDTREIADTKLEHVYTNYVSNNDATCLEDGTETATCDLNCGTTSARTDEGSALGHSFTNYVSDGNATCTTDGTKTAKCDRCDVTDTIADVGSVLGHAYGEYTSNGDATCTADGTKTAECSRCHEKDTVTDEGSKLDHSFTEYVSDNNATCTKDGTETAKCGNCDATDTRIVENSTVDHRYTTYVSNEDATCKADGTKTAECDFGCGSKDTIADEGSKLPHTEAIDTAVDATCTATGLTEGSHCSVCGEVIVKQEVVEMKPHSYDAVVTAPTCTADGYTTYTCSVCGNSYTGDPVEANGHDYGDGVYTAPTFDADGYTTYTCHCGDSYTVTDEGTQLIAVARIGETRYQTLDEAIADSVEGDEIILLAKATVEGDVRWDLTGKTLTTCEVDGNYSIVVKGSLTITGGTFNVNGVYGIGVQSGASLTIEDGTFTASANSDYLIGSWGSVTISGGEFQGVYSCVNRFDGTVSISGGSFTTEATDSTGEYDSVDVLGDENVTISGGSFSKEVDASHLAEGCCAPEIEGRYVVDEHDYASTVTPPTCTEAGFTTHTCSRCSDTYTDSETPNSGHSYEATVTAPTCTTPGYTTYTCGACGDSYVGDEVPAANHSYSAVVTAPTCVDKGYTTYTCSACGDSYVADEVAALGHSWNDADCDTPKTCSVCGETEGEALGHSWVDADCTTPKTCSVCGETEGEALGHSYSSVVTAPTCVEKGYTTYTCSACGDSYVADEVAALGHSWNNADCDTPKTCSVCGETEGEALGHSYSSVVTAPTCVDKGYTTYTCTACGDSYVADEVAATGEHNYVDGKCSVCGDEEPVEVVPVTIASSMQAYLTLESEVYLNIAFKLENLGETDPATLENRVGLLIWDAAEAPADDEATVENCEYIIDYAEYSVPNKRYQAQTLGIPAKDLGDALTFRAYYIDDNGDYTYGRIIKNYSPKRYCYNMLKDSDTSDDALMIAILNYATSAQKYFEYHQGYVVEEYINATLTDEQKTLTWDGSLVRTDWSIPAAKEGSLTRNKSVITSRGAYLTLLGAIDYNFYFKVSGIQVAKAEALVWNEAAYNSAEVLNEENASVYEMEYVNANSRYEYTQAGLAAKEMFSPIYVCAKITDTDGNVYYSGVVAYCPERFAAINAESDIAVDAELAKRLVIYGDAARTYFAK